MCLIASPKSNPVQGETYHVFIWGQSPLSWSWSISGDFGSDEGSTSTSPEVVDIPVPDGSDGETLTFNLSCGGAGQDSEEWLIEAE